MTDATPNPLYNLECAPNTGSNRYPAMSERFRLSGELENARYQNNLLTEKCRELEKERDEARREILESLHPDLRESYAAAREWDCFNTPEGKLDKTVNGVIVDGGKAVPPKYEDLGDE
jgi:hypothetical protein